jgi:hypothetical protein
MNEKNFSGGKALSIDECLAAAAFTECLFREKPSPSGNRQSWPERESSVRAAFAGLENAVPSVLKTVREKFIESGSAKARLLEEGLLDIWDDIADRRIGTVFLEFMSSRFPV